MTIREIARDAAITKTMMDVEQIKKQLQPQPTDPLPNVTLGQLCRSLIIGVIAAPFLIAAFLAVMFVVFYMGELALNFLAAMGV